MQELKRKAVRRLTPAQRKLVRRWRYFPKWVLNRYEWVAEELGWEEALSVGFLALCSAAIHYRPGEFQFSTYAHACIRNRLVQAAVRSRDKKELLPVSQEMLNSGAFAEPGKFFDDQDSLLLRALGELSERERKVISLLFLEGKNLREAGEAFGFSPERARQVRNRALKKLRGLLWFTDGVLTMAQ